MVLVTYNSALVIDDCLRSLSAAQNIIVVDNASSDDTCEVIHGGLQAVPTGQREAAHALGLSNWQNLRLIVLPQALKVSIPGIVNTFIGLYKDTTLVLIICLLHLLGVGTANLADSKWLGLSSEVYVFVAILFFIACFGMSRYSIYLQNKLHIGHEK